ncbi:Cyclin N-terminal domain-containing protein [Heracleum sosnowskyi]|uniref:Cyclin N-terminal domain-containing protein n=1 Tax=Heracleum sosnowskyi TaxID=360622 RepID=A0AAD8M2D7_9APIA|nr:Cyclin N-terminal domain-containing protein [Heracleum sosnowskyi]
MNRYASPAAQLEITTYDEIVDENPGLCVAMVREIYDHLRASKANKRPCIDYMAKVQKLIDIRMRAMLIDWLVEVVEVYAFDPEILYLAVNYIDRYLSGNPMDTERLQLLGIACMMIASKYHDIDSPPVEVFCQITAHTYSVDDIREMESIVLHFLKFELTIPTARCFLESFVRVAQAVTEDPLMELESLSNYLADLSLRDYGMLSDCQLSETIVLPTSTALHQYLKSTSTTYEGQILGVYTRAASNSSSDRRK